MTFYLVHTRISCVALAFARTLDSVAKREEMTREGVDLDVKLPSTFREVFKYEIDIFLRKNSPGSFKLTPRP